MREANPALVYTSITGFGPDGPYAGLKAYEGVVAAKVGLYGRGIFGSVRGPCSPSNLIASSGAAHLAVSGTLAALIVRDTTGRGQRVDTSLVQGLIAADYFGVYHAQLAKRCGGSGRGARHRSRRRDGREPVRAHVVYERRPVDEPVASTAAPGPSVAQGRGAGVDPRRRPLRARAVLPHCGGGAGVGRRRLGDSSAPRHMPSSRPPARRRTTFRSSCAAPTKRHSTTRRSSPTAR